MYDSLKWTTNDIFQQFYISLKICLIFLNGDDKRVVQKGLALFFDEITTNVCTNVRCLKTFNLMILPGLFLKMFVWKIHHIFQ